MFIRVTTTPKSPRKSVKVVESVREGLKVKQVMIHHVGIAADDNEIEKLKVLGRDFIIKELVKRAQGSSQKMFFPLLTPEEVRENLEKSTRETFFKKKGRPHKFEDVLGTDLVSLKDLTEESRVIEGLHDVAGCVFGEMGYSLLLKRQKDTDLLRDLVLMRIGNPRSKLMTQNLLEKRFARVHDLDVIYRLMDKLFGKIDQIKQLTFLHTQSLIPDRIDILFFDCTTLYFESTETDDLRSFGFSKDHRFNTTQVVLALATNQDGMPIGYELFEGNKAEVKTLLACLQHWQALFKIEKVCFVADRAMMSDENMKVLEASGHQYILAAKLRSLPQELQNQILDETQYTSFEGGTLQELTHKDRRLIVSYKEDRAKHDVYKRDKVLQKIQKNIGEKGNTLKLLSNTGVKKYTTTRNAETTLDQDKIAADKAWDGLHGVITNIPSSEKEASIILSRYRRLWKIEECFRINKHTLSMRPIYHFKPERIKSHIALCYMAFSVLRRMEYTVSLKAKLSPEVLIDELMHVEASYLRHKPSGTFYRMPGKFGHNASKIYHAFNIKRLNQAQKLI